MISPVVQQILHVFKSRGSENYGSEAVTQLQHAIQSGMLAQRDGASQSQVMAALLHDIGHILGKNPLPDNPSQNYDDKHETSAYAWLLKHFGPAIADPVRLHVAAKRYLCTVDPAYSQTLSPTSLKSFYDQGGTMNDQEKLQFEQETYYREALQLRRWDDLAKDPAMQMLDIDDFTQSLQQALISE